MDYLILSIIGVACLSVLFFIAKRFTTKTHPQRTQELFVILKELENHGFIYKGDRYEANYKGYHTSIFAATNIKGNDQVMVMVATETGSAPLDFLKTFLSGYFVNGENGGCSYVGFRLFMNAYLSPAEGVQKKLDTLIDKFNEKGVRPFKIQG